MLVLIASLTRVAATTVSIWNRVPNLRQRAGARCFCAGSVRKARVSTVWCDPLLDVIYTPAQHTTSYMIHVSCIVRLHFALRMSTQTIIHDLCHGCDPCLMSEVSLMRVWLTSVVAARSVCICGAHPTTVQYTSLWLSLSLPLSVYRNAITVAMIVYCILIQHTLHTATSTCTCCVP